MIQIIIVLLIVVITAKILDYMENTKKITNTKIWFIAGVITTILFDFLNTIFK